jgi:hypothetical protein
MDEFEIRIDDQNRGSGKNMSVIEPQLHRVLRDNASALIGFGTPFTSWLESEDESALVFKKNRTLMKFYRFYIWLIIHFEFCFNIYLIRDSYLYYDSKEALSRIANLMSKFVWNASAVVLINSKSKFGHKLIRSISKIKYLNNNESIEALRLFGLKLEKLDHKILYSGRVFLIFSYPIICHMIMLFTIIFSIENPETNDWMTFLNPIFLFNIMYSILNFTTFMAFTQTLQFKFENLAKFAESNTKKSDLSKEEFVVIKKW